MTNKYFRNTLLDIDKGNWKTFSVNNKKISIPVQLDLFARDYSKKAHITMGLFYEKMSTTLFGGKLADQLNVKKGLKNIIIKPDIFVPNRKKIIESKAMRSGHQLILLDDQIERYNFCQFLYPNYKIYYIIWRHSLRGIKTYSQSLDKLINDLCENTLCCMILPFSIIMAIHKSINFQRYEVENWHKCTLINSDFVNQIFVDQSVFFSRIPIEKERFDVEYFNMPEILFNDKIIKSFPIAFVKDNDYKVWADNITKKYEAPF